MSVNTEQTPVSQNDRIMAALGHSTAILPMMGVIAPIIIWATQKDKSEYVAFQALQAIAYQFIMILIWFAGMALYMGSFFLTFLTIPLSGHMDTFPVFFFVPFLVMGGMMFAMLCFVIYGLVAAVMALQGRDFRYIILGNQLKKYLAKPNQNASIPQA
ncbi:MAG TPA: DUF4870 domain-containing protein [Anaerolineales bacterium]|nr:DUF4870 domain-containing protein [Anaerolineales bacterium]